MVARAFTSKKLTYDQALAIITQHQDNSTTQTSERTLVIIVSLDNESESESEQERRGKDKWTTPE